MERTSRILIVDDDPLGRKALEGPLAGQGYDLAFAANGPEALEKASKLTPDLILLDIMMPGMDGFEVCQRLRSDSKLAEVPIVMVTALDDQESRIHGIEVGADDFISKPFNRLELRAKVNTITRLNRYRRLLDERSRFEWVVEQVDDGYLLLTPDDVILYANPQACLYLGINPDFRSNIPEKFLALAQKQYRCEPQDIWALWPKNAASQQGQGLFLVQPETSTTNATWLQASILEQPTGPENVYLIRLRDVTNAMTTQRDMATFHGMLNHKLRTPLSALQMTIEVLANENIDLPRSETLEIASMAMDSIKGLSSDILDILDYLEAPAQAVTGIGFSLKDLMPLAKQVAEELELSSVDIDYEPKLDIYITTLSQKAFETLLWELLENSKKFHPFHSPNVEIIATAGKDMTMTLKILDDGISLSPEQIAHAWRPYYQGEKHFTGALRGMGLGLSLVSNLVWQVGGKCALFNRDPGPGVIVEVNIPIK